MKLMEHEPDVNGGLGATISLQGAGCHELWWWIRVGLVT